MDESRLNKCVVHLRIFSQLRNLQIQTVNQINIVALKIDIGKDPFFEKGKAEGIDYEFKKNHFTKHRTPRYRHRFFQFVRRSKKK